MTTRCCFG